MKLRSGNKEAEDKKKGNVGDHAKQGVVLQCKAVGIDCILAEILKSIPWRALQTIKKAFEMRYIGENKEDIEMWLKNIIVLIPKKVIDKLEVQTRSICGRACWTSCIVDASPKYLKWN